MAHFSQINQNNIVINVTYLDNEILLDENGVEKEELGLQHILNTIDNADQYTWKQTSINRNFRGVYGYIGTIYDEINDRFISKKPHDSWTLSIDFEWEPPIPRPEETEEMLILSQWYEWDENAYQEDNSNGWVIKSL